MRRLRIGKLIVALGLLGSSVGAAPAAPSYRDVEVTIEKIRSDWKTGSIAQPNAPGWSAFFDALNEELRRYSSAKESNAQLVSLNRIYQMSTALTGISWPPAVELREELREWLRPRVRLAWAGRRLVDSVHSLTTTDDAQVLTNRRRWIDFVGDDLGASLRQYDGAETVAQRLDALKHVYGALNLLKTRNQARPWVPSIELERALHDLYNLPNLDISADLATLTPVLSQNVIETGPIYRKGYVSQVTAGPKTGFGLLPSEEGIAFYNSQKSTSVTPIWDFNSQMERDPRGKQATKLFYFTATTTDHPEVTIVAVLSPSGLRLEPRYQHDVDATVDSFKIHGQVVGRGVASVMGLDQAAINRRVYEGAIGRMRQNVEQEAAELGAERTAAAAAEQNARLAQFLIGNDSLAFRNLLITGLRLRSRPELALVGGTLQWRGASDQVGADAPRPAKFAAPEAGVTANLHLTSILTSLVRGYLQSDAVRGLKNLMVVTKKVPADAPPSQGVVLSTNADYPTFLQAVKAARAANDPKVLAVRVVVPGHSPEFAADARGFLIALVHDFVIEVPAPPTAARGGLFGPAAQVYRITAPTAEFAISFKVTSETEKSPIRLSGRIEGFDPGPDAKVLALDEDETKATPLTKFAGNVVLGVMRTKMQGQPVDFPLSNVQLRGFAIREVSPLDPTGWIRVNLLRTSNSPAAGIQ